MSRLRVAVVGAGGRMGAEVCRAVAGAGDMTLVAAVDPAHAGRPVTDLTGSLAEEGGPPVGAGTPAEAGPVVVAGTLGEAATADVVVDFTALEVARRTLTWCADRRIHVVVGTTGIGAADVDDLRRRFPPGGPAGCVIAPNFAIGAVLMMRFAELAAPWFETAEIVELHHNAKRDAPSGTAVLTAERMAEARRQAAAGGWAADPTRIETLPGARGAVGPAGVHVHSVRLRGLVAHQEVLLGTAGQSLTLRHDSYDRSSFMPGVLLAARSVVSRPGVTLGLDALLGL